MDGRRIRKLWLSGCLVAGALGCSSTRNSNTNVPPFFSDAKPLTGMPMASKSKSFWGGSSNKPAAPTEVSATDYDAPAKPETHAILANAQVDSAFNEETPTAGREALLDQARQGYQKALKMDARNKVALNGLAKYYVRLGEREKAVETYKRYFAAHPRDKDVAHEVALAHAQWKDWAGAAAWCEFALKIDPENLSIRKTMAFCLARAGKWDEGFAVMCQVMPEAQARYLMARVLEHQNQPDACRQQLQLAIQADPAHIASREFLVELDQVTRPIGTPNQNPIITVGGTTEPNQ
jgi:tetratricopeptide (TPR) repeat protein